MREDQAEQMIMLLSDIKNLLFIRKTKRVKGLESVETAYEKAFVEGAKKVVKQGNTPTLKLILDRRPFLKNLPQQDLFKMIDGLIDRGMIEISISETTGRERYFVVKEGGSVI